MAQRTASCPNCGATIAFRWSSAVQTTCQYCHSILVRHDIDLERVGVVSDLPETSTPIQLGTEGVYGRTAFVVIGRIVYEYDRGSWSEWYCSSDAAGLWLSDAQLELAVSRLVPPLTPLPGPNSVGRGMIVSTKAGALEVTTLTRAAYRGVEGELPFEYWDKKEVLFADLGAADGRFGTIDYSESPPLLFSGEYVGFDALQFRNVREFEGWQAP